MLIDKLIDHQLIKPPDFIRSNTVYLTITGSTAYGCQDTNKESDLDVYGVCIPSKHIIFPHLNGEIEGFGRQKKRFEQYQSGPIVYDDGNKRKEYDLTIYNIVRYFTLCMENNPNMVDTLFTDLTCVLHSTAVGNLIRDNRKIFIHKGLFFKFIGYAVSQLHKAANKNPIGKRKESKEKFGYDPKFLYHVLRLLLECEQLLETGEMDLMRDRELYKAIRKGEMGLEEVRKFFEIKDLALKKLYETSTIPYSPDETKIKTLLLQCLEMHYGSLDKCIVIPDIEKRTLREIDAILSKVRHLL